MQLATLKPNGVLAANYRGAKLEEGCDVTFEVESGSKGASLHLQVSGKVVEF